MGVRGRTRSRRLTAISMVTKTAPESAVPSPPQAPDTRPLSPLDLKIASIRAQEAARAASEAAADYRSARQGPNKCDSPGRSALTSLEPQETSVEYAPAVVCPAELGLFASKLPVIERTKTKLELALDGCEPWTSADAARCPYGPYDIAPAAELETNFRHSGWAETRSRTLDALKRTGAGVNRLNAFCNCGSQCIVKQHVESGDVRTESNKCHDRFCQVCASERSRNIVRNLLEATESKELRFVTLTLKHCHLRLNLHIDRLQTCFRNLRARAFWKEHIAGGAAFLEIKTSADGRLWHPHIHLLVEGKYLPQDQLAAEWLAVTGDSFVVDVRYVHDRKKAAAYVAKYASKPLDPSLFRNPEKLDEAIICLKGRRLCTTLGSWRGFELEKTPEPAAGWVSLGLLTTLKRQADDGDERAQAIISALWERKKSDRKANPGKGADP